MMGAIGGGPGVVASLLAPVAFHLNMTSANSRPERRLMLNKCNVPLHGKLCSRLLVFVKASAHLEVICTHFCSAIAPITPQYCHIQNNDGHPECREREKKDEIISQTVVSVY